MRQPVSALVHLVGAVHHFHRNCFYGSFCRAIPVDAAGRGLGALWARPYGERCASMTYTARMYPESLGGARSLGSASGCVRGLA